MLAIGSDHAGYELKCEVKKFLDGLGVEYIDCGCNGERADYPDIAEKTCEKIKSGECDKGILICGIRKQDKGYPCGFVPGLLYGKVHTSSQ